ncbi:MAG: hypothetical protein KAS96_00060 [Planctomycetes bacterium]|nr:hypothetical protein [Planctomycetota bacterium]
MIDVSDGNAVYYYHFDNLGNVAAISDISADFLINSFYLVKNKTNLNTYRTVLKYF